MAIDSRRTILIVGISKTRGVPDVAGPADEVGGMARVAIVGGVASPSTRGCSSLCWRASPKWGVGRETPSFSSGEPEPHGLAFSSCLYRSDPRALEHPPQFDYLLIVDIARPRGAERLGLRADGHLIEPIALLNDRAHLAQKGKNIVPLNVVASWMAENSLHGGSMMRVQLGRFCHVRLLECLPRATSPHVVGN